MILSGVAYLNIIKINESCILLSLCSAYLTADNNLFVSLSMSNYILMEIKSHTHTTSK